MARAGTEIDACKERIRETILSDVDSLHRQMKGLRENGVKLTSHRNIQYYLLLTRIDSTMQVEINIKDLISI